MPAAAQSRADDALRRFREGKIDIMDQLLFKQSGKTTRIIYLRELETPQSLPACCGEGLFGQTRQRFVIDKVVVGVSAGDWQKLAFHEVEGEKLVYGRLSVACHYQLVLERRAAERLDVHDSVRFSVGCLAQL